VNAGNTSVTERTVLNLRYADNSASLMGAGIFALGSFNITIPNGSVDYKQIVECQSGRDLHVFAAFPHMHALGNKISFDTGTTMATATNAYKKDPWVFGNQPMDPLDLTVHNGDFMRATCEWDNATGHDVHYGESSSDEMCFMILFYYPFTELDGCIQ
jgi:hypothetical protein